MKKLLALFSLPFLSLMAAGCASSVFFAQQMRFPASGAELMVGHGSPSVQSVTGEQADAFLRGIARLVKKIGDPADEKNLAELGILEKSLELRGLMPQEGPLPQPMRRDSRLAELYRKTELDQHVPAMNGEEAYTTIVYDFYYKKGYLEKGKVPTARDPLPLIRLYGRLYMHCQPKRQCEISNVGLEGAAVIWEYPSSPRGANSSAGGAGQN